MNNLPQSINYSKQIYKEKRYMPEIETNAIHFIFYSMTFVKCKKKNINFSSNPESVLYLASTK
jgi:hypothetical protein